jgi:hypothetical protein
VNFFTRTYYFSISIEEQETNIREESQAWSQNDFPEDIPPQTRNFVEGIVDAMKNGTLDS